MKVIIYLLGFACIAYCTYFNLYTSQAVRTLKGMFQNYHLRYLAAIPAVVAVLFLLAAPAAKCPWPFWIIGILAAMEAVVAFLNPQKIYSRSVDWFFENLSDQAFKFLAIMGVILGTLILTLAK
jgi:hypothetical protein